MNANTHPIGGVPLLGQQQMAEQAAAQQLALSMYVPLIPQLTIFRLARGYEVEGGLTEPATPERVAEEADEFVRAAMRRLGFKAVP